ncbi:hypothetical protein ACFSHP_07545 [Novosphingobium panipatense]
MEALRSFLKFGGTETILSYGVDKDVLREADWEEAQRLMNAAIPQEDIDFLAGFKQLVCIGDYVFVHAGVRPDTPLDQQRGRDCRWIANRSSAIAETSAASSCMATPSPRSRTSAATALASIPAPSCTER